MWHRLNRLAVSLLLCSAFASKVHSELATRQESDKVARNWVTEMTSKRGTWASSTNPTVTRVHEILMDGVALARLYDVSPRGYVVVPVLKEMGPIQAYSDESNLNEDQEGGMMQLLKDVLSGRMALYRQAYGDLAAEQPAAGDVVFDRGQRANWDRLVVPAREFQSDQGLSESAEAGPLLTSSWHQFAPYNNDCPIGNTGRCLVGCTATALAQILRYWEWPPSGIGSHSYYWSGDKCNGSGPGQTLFADFSDSYDWPNMPDSCDGVGGCTPEQEAALAELCYEVGNSVHMNYSSCASGGVMDMGVFPAHFNYSNAVSRECRINHTKQSWFNLLKAEIDAGRVMWYYINGHSIVCDGYRINGSQLEYHMNYGWGQGNNAWYVLDNLQCSWVTGGICPYEEEHLTFHIEPQYHPDIKLVGRTIDDIGDHDGLVEKGETVAVTIEVQNLANIATNAMGTLSTADPFVLVTTPSALFDFSFGWGEHSFSNTPFVIQIDAACPDPHLALLEVQIEADGGYVETLSFPLFIGTQCGWSDYMESGQGYWTHKQVGVPFQVLYKDEWHLDTYRAHSGVTSWKVGGAGPANYSDLSDGVLVTPPFLLPAEAKLRFWHWMEAEMQDPALVMDGGIVMISAGDGIWTQIHPDGEYPNAVCTIPTSPYTCPFAPGTPCYSGSHSWSQAHFDLSAYSGVVQLMFRFGSDALSNLEDREGWYIDDIWVGSDSCCTGRVGDADGQGEYPDEITVGDIMLLIDVKFISGDCSKLTCLQEADVNQNGGSNPNCYQHITLADISVLIDFLFITGPTTAVLPECL